MINDLIYWIRRYVVFEIVWRQGDETSLSLKVIGVGNKTDAQITFFDPALFIA